MFKKSQSEVVENLISWSIALQKARIEIEKSIKKEEEWRGGGGEKK